MTNDQPAWPSERIALDAVAQWIFSACAVEDDAPEILQVKRWGVTARFESVVFKASFTPLFPQVTRVHALLEQITPPGAPRLLARRDCWRAATARERYGGGPALDTL